MIPRPNWLDLALGLRDALAPVQAGGGADAGRGFVGRRVGHAGRVRLQTLVAIRWIAVIGQTLTLLLVHYGLDFRLPLGATLSVVGVSAALNVALFLLYPSSTRLSDGGAALYLAFDIVQLAGLLYLTGGLENPFALLVLVPVTISATILRQISTILLGGLAFLCITLLAFWHLPLPWPEPGFALPLFYLFAVWAALILGMGLVAIYASQVAAEARRMSDALAATQMALAREQQLSALGGLAAAAAHELGTPLGTIAVAAKELSREVPPGSPLAEDVALIAGQAARCRDILARLSRRPEDEEGGEAFSFLPIAGLVEAAATTHRDAGVRVETVLVGSGPQPVVARSSEIIHGLGNLIENAVDFARQRVELRIGWDEREVRVEILDDGPGINIDVLSALGDPYVTTRPDDGGMGLGVFIAKTLLEHTGARVRFGNRPGGGAAVTATWPRRLLERPAGASLLP